MVSHDPYFNLQHKLIRQKKKTDMFIEFNLPNSMDLRVQAFAHTDGSVCQTISGTFDGSHEIGFLQINFYAFSKNSFDMD